VLVDGSGLSYENRVTPRLLVAALRAAEHSFAFGAEFEAALPIAAADGTLAERASGAPFRVRAKTGLLTRVTGLSGYAQRAGGGRVAFSVLVNGFRGSAESAMDAVDRFAEALAAEP
jgi:D-alanyl-D-alanine carboxypeptidase/D-alanyl-D-alanine-endopeptidase (penicillin-binding protein 4)